MQAPEGVHEISSATIRLRTTERGLPVAMALSPQALSVPPDELARRILALCELSARRAQVGRRRHLVANGCPPSVADGLNLSTAEELRRIEADLLVGGSTDDLDELPETWLRDV